MLIPEALSDLFAVAVAVAVAIAFTVIPYVIMGSTDLGVAILFATCRSPEEKR